MQELVMSQCERVEPQNNQSNHHIIMPSSPEPKVQQINLPENQNLTVTESVIKSQTKMEGKNKNMQNIAGTEKKIRKQKQKQPLQGELPAPFENSQNPDTKDPQIQGQPIKPKRKPRSKAQKQTNEIEQNIGPCVKEEVLATQNTQIQGKQKKRKPKPKTNQQNTENLQNIVQKDQLNFQLDPMKIEQKIGEMEEDKFEEIKPIKTEEGQDIIQNKLIYNTPQKKTSRNKQKEIIPQKNNLFTYYQTSVGKQAKKTESEQQIKLEKKPENNIFRQVDSKQQLSTWNQDRMDQFEQLNQKIEEINIQKITDYFPRFQKNKILKNFHNYIYEFGKKDYGIKLIGKSQKITGKAPFSIDRACVDYDLDSEEERELKEADKKNSGIKLIGKCQKITGKAPVDYDIDSAGERELELVDSCSRSFKNGDSEQDENQLDSIDEQDSELVSDGHLSKDDFSNSEAFNFYFCEHQEKKKKKINQNNSAIMPSSQFFKTYTPNDDIPQAFKSYQIILMANDQFPLRKKENDQKNQQFFDTEQNMRDFITYIHGSYNSIKQISQHMKNNYEKCSMQSAEKKLKEIAEKKKIDQQKQDRWFVKNEILQQYSVTEEQIIKCISDYQTEFEIKHQQEKKQKKEENQKKKEELDKKREDEKQLLMGRQEVIDKRQKIDQSNEGIVKYIKIGQGVLNTINDSDQKAKTDLLLSNNQKGLVYQKTKQPIQQKVDKKNQEKTNNIQTINS